MRVVLISCCGPKGAAPQPARDLYCSALFRASRRWAEQQGEQWFILSAKYGLVEPSAVIAPYDLTLSSLGRAGRARWNEQIRVALHAHHHDDLTVLAGASYCGWCADFPQVTIPLAGLSGIGRRIRWLTQHSP